MEIKVKKLTKEAILPVKAHDTDAGFDLTATSKSYDDYGNVVYGTGIAVSIPPGYFGLLAPRSSVSKKALSLANSVGIIDSGYVGELILKYKPAGRFPVNNPFFNNYGIGDKIGQLIILPLPDIQLVETEQLDQTDRGTAGFGSTGN